MSIRSVFPSRASTCRPTTDTPTSTPPPPRATSSYGSSRRRVCRSDGIEQAVNFLNAVGRRHLDLGLAIDVEEQGNARGVPVDSVKARLQLMVEYLNMAGHRVTLYSNRTGWEKYLMPEFEGMPLWICSFNDENAMSGDWTYWQHNHRGKVAGVRGDVDINAYSGSRRQWEEEMRRSAPRRPAHPQ